MWTYKFDPGWVRPLCELMSLTLGGIRLLCGLMSLTLGGIRPLCGLISLTLGGIRPLCGLISLTLVGSVHFVNRVDPWWDPSTLWTYKFDPGWVRPPCELC